MNNIPLLIGLLSTLILSLYCVNFYTEPILNRLNCPVVKVDLPKIVTTKPDVTVIEEQKKIVLPSPQPTHEVEKKVDLPKIVNTKHDVEVIETQKKTLLSTPQPTNEVEKKVELPQHKSEIKENELDALAKKILEDMKKNKD